MYVVFALLAAITAALVAIFGKIGLSKLDTTLATTLRSVVMAGMLIVATTAARRWNFAHLDNKALLYIVLAGAAGASSWLFYFLALKSGPATAVAALDRLSVVFVIVLSALFLGESLTAKSVLGGTLIVAGALLLIK